ncbi:MAG TPA: hypothetical protein VIU46_06400 [Gallionellaceae bacterium]
MTAAPPETVKQRELVFSTHPPGQADRAFQLLTGLEDLQVERCKRPNALLITYSLLDYALESLEQALVKEGFCLEDSTLGQISKKLTYYREEVEYHNLNIPDRHARDRKREIFIKAYEHHLHGDHDDTPPELREYK